MTRIKRGSVWLADLSPPRGAEPGKTRPVLVLQHQRLLDEGHPSTVILPLTTNLLDDADPLRFRIAARDGLEKDSDVLIDQVRAIDNRRLVKGPLTELGEPELYAIAQSLNQVLGCGP